MGKPQTETKTEVETQAPPTEQVAATPASAQPNWMSQYATSVSRAAGNNPVKATIVAGVAAHQVSTKVVDPLASKAVDFFGKTFGKAAEAKVEESVQEEAVAQATGGILGAAADYVGAAFAGVID